MITIEEFHIDFIQTVLSDAESRGLLKTQSFFENVCEELVEIGDLTVNYTAAEYTKRGMEVYGYDFEEERGLLTLIAHQFYQSDFIETMTLNQITTKFNRLKSFYLKCLSGIYKEMEETSEAYSMAFNIYLYFQKNLINRVRFMIISDGKATRNLLELPSERIDNQSIEYRVIDLEYIYKSFAASNRNLDFEIDVDLPCLITPIVTDEYQSFLTVLSGPVIAEIYENYGQKLFEQNVRTFLQFKGGVNKGIRNTIEYRPHMFFAYNNGITATANEVCLDENGRIKRIKNFQIVNGAQTTSSIYSAWKNSKFNIDNIFVQMKLSVVANIEHQNDFVSKVSEFANTQNKINQSDFFSNSAYHRELKDRSKIVWAPVTDGLQKRTRWFYERVRGEYLNELASRTAAESKRFQIENPKIQVVDKTFISKTEMSWLQRPDIVSKGSQYSFSVFADYVSPLLEESRLIITDDYYKDVISRVILFRDVEKLVSSATWYDGGFRAQTVTYTISYLSKLVEKTGKLMDFKCIWDLQSTPKELLRILEVVADVVYKSIMNPPAGSANIGQWCKKSDCWNQIKLIDLNLQIPEKYLLNKEDQREREKANKKIKRIDNEVEIQKVVISTDSDTWVQIYNHYSNHISEARYTATQFDILRKVSTGIISCPSEKQSKILYAFLERAEAEGII